VVVVVVLLLLPLPLVRSHQDRESAFRITIEYQRPLKNCHSTAPPSSFIMKEGYSHHDDKKCWIIPSECIRKHYVHPSDFLRAFNARYELNLSIQEHHPDPAHSSLRAKKLLKPKAKMLRLVHGG
jgi:hypothetical protein